MSKIGQYIHWCEEQGYTNSQGEVTSMKYAEEYMRTQQYFKEHMEQRRLELDEYQKSKQKRYSDS
jgi:hypothetical protein|tara:strand:+ start:222 stop:416 length:195 start_codon:yes stop_codon:yes gene_type:complete